MRTRLILLTLIIPLFFLVSAYAGHGRPERDYQAEWCNACGGQMEHVLPCGARVDCLTKGYAVECDFGPKWAESVGQALYYAEQTGKRPGIVLILERSSDRRYLDRLMVIAEKYGITVWTVGEGAR